MYFKTKPFPGVKIEHCSGTPGIYKHTTAIYVTDFHLNRIEQNYEI